MLGSTGLRTAQTRRSDEQLVEAVLRGERRAFEQLVRRHQRGVVRHIHRQTGRPETARDVAQEVFLKVYRALPSYDPKYRFTTWLYRIASNCAIDLLRRRQLETCSLNSAEDGDGADSGGRTLAGSDPSPHEMLQYREVRTRLETAIGELPPEYRKLILLRHRQHCRYDEIAEISRLPIGTVKNRIFRARAMLREALSDVLDTEA